MKKGIKTKFRKVVVTPAMKAIIECEVRKALEKTPPTKTVYICIGSVIGHCSNLGDCVRKGSVGEEMQQIVDDATVSDPNDPYAW